MRLWELGLGRALVCTTLLILVGGSLGPVAAVEISPGDILIINQYDGLVLVNPVTGAQTLVSSGGFLSNPLGVALELSGQVVVADPVVGVIRVDPSSGAQTLLAGRVDRFVLSGPRSVVVAPNGEIFVVDELGSSGGGEVIRLDPVTGAQTLVSSDGNFVIIVDLVLTATGDILVVDQNAFGGSGGVIKVDPVTGAQTPLSSGGSFIEPFGIAINNDTGSIFVTDPDADAVFQVDPVTGAQTTIASVGGDLRGVGVEANGDLLVVIQPSTLVRVNPLTGAQTVLSSGGLFDHANEIAIAGVVKDAVTIPRAIFGKLVSTLFVSATSSSSPDAALFVTVPDCLTDAPMNWNGNVYVLLRRVKNCGNLDGQTVTVTSSQGGVATATLKYSRP